MQTRINALAKLGEILKQPENDIDIMQAVSQAERENAWFTESFILFTLKYWGDLLNEKRLNDFIANYSAKPKSIKRVGIIMAGNIPLVGMHDLIMIILSGHTAIVKLSSKDKVLPKVIVSKLSQFLPELKEQIRFESELFKNTDAVIATGSDNSARYFEQYFGKLPHIIRKNRNSLAVLSGNESKEELEALCNDVFMYFGLGCRSVSKVYVPKGYDVTKILDACESWSQLMEHNKYMNNYVYQKAILLMDLQKHLDNDFLLLREHADLASPLSVLYYEHYENQEDLIAALSFKQDDIQCISTNIPNFPNSIPLGTCQTPQLNTFADNIDSMEFLLSL